MKRLLSYIYPITKKITSKHSGTLEVTWYNGKKHLNTKNANYSYGSLQKILKIGLQKIDLHQCKKVLILGMGGGSVIQTLKKVFTSQHHITAIDIDPVIIAIAKDEFEVAETTQLEIICTDALDFMQRNKKLFDLIIIDLFIDIEIPAPFFSTSFWEAICSATHLNGSILFNASLHHDNTVKLTAITNLLKTHHFEVEKTDKVDNTNTLLIAKKIPDQ